MRNLRSQQVNHFSLLAVTAIFCFYNRFFVWFFNFNFHHFPAIIELFHLLPQAAGKFLDDLVSLTIDLEGALPQGQFYSEINSPYRLPLTKFLNRYATDAVDYFLARLGQPEYFRR